MNSLRFWIVCVMVCGLTSIANARLGETVNEVFARYGELKEGSYDGKTLTANTGETPDHYILSGSGASRVYTNTLDPKLLKSAEFDKYDFKTRVLFTQGKSVSEEYERKGGELNAKDIEALLQANGDGKKWTELKSPPSRSSWMREDGARAGFVGDSQVFRIWFGGTPSGAQEAGKEQKSKPPTGF